MSFPENHLVCDDESEANRGDNESLQEKCWQEQYKGGSRKWLIRDASANVPQGPLCSTMKESYLYREPERSVPKHVGKKKEMLLKKFYEEAAREVLREYETKEEPNDYCTEYDGNYKAKGFKPENDFYKKNTEKYPLYSSAPVSYYSFNCQKNPGGVLHGLTRITDRQNIFKRNGQFSKPLNESLDFTEL